jgi:hypothetical protein
MAELVDGFATHAFEIDVIIAFRYSLFDGFRRSPDVDCL